MRKIKFPNPFAHFVLCKDITAAQTYLDKVRSSMSQKEFEAAIMNHPQEDYTVAPATGWATLTLVNTKAHYFKEGGVYSACGQYRAADVPSHEEFYDRDHKSSDNCGLCRAARETFLSIPVQS